jgi:hypothetical protein
MGTRFWIGAALGAAVAWYFFAPRANGANPGVGGATRGRNKPRGQAGYSGFGRWR